MNTDTGVALAVYIDYRFRTVHCAWVKLGQYEEEIVNPCISLAICLIDLVISLTGDIAVSTAAAEAYHNSESDE